MGSAMHRAIGVATAIGVMISADVARGEPSIAPATDGIGTTVQQQGDRYDISGGTRAGDNLFHSFQRLGLSSQEIANFLATPDLNAIVGRVTGGNPSVIDGLIRVSGGNPNLYLMNPAGIVFGAGARLDVPASFTATTATSLGFSDGGWFPATGAVDFAGLGGSLSWLEFASLRPGSLVNAGQLTVPAGQNLWLISGGGMLSTGTLQAPGGTVAIAAIPGTNRVRIAPDGSTLSLEVVLPQPGAMAGRSLPELLAGGQLSSASRLVANPDGSVSLRAIAAGNYAVLPDRGAVVSGSVDVSSTTGQGGNVTIAGDRVGLIGAQVDASGLSGGGRLQVGGSERGNGGVFGAQLTLVDADSRLQANALNVGNGGQAIIWSDKTTWFDGAIAARGGPFGGNGGFVEVSGKQDLMLTGQVDLRAAQGTMGTLLLDPRDIRIAAGNGTGATTRSSLQSTGSDRRLRDGGDSAPVDSVAATPTEPAPSGDPPAEAPVCDFCDLPPLAVGKSAIPPEESSPAPSDSGSVPSDSETIPVDAPIGDDGSIAVDSLEGAVDNPDGDPALNPDGTLAEGGEAADGTAAGAIAWGSTPSNSVRPTPTRTVTSTGSTRIGQGDSSSTSANLDSVVTEQQLEALAETSNLVLVADRDIVLDNLPDDRLSLRAGSVRWDAGRNITFVDRSDQLQAPGSPVVSGG